MTRIAFIADATCQTFIRKEAHLCVEFYVMTRIDLLAEATIQAVIYIQFLADGTSLMVYISDNMRFKGQFKPSFSSKTFKMEDR